MYIINRTMNEKHISVYKLSQLSRLPYTTVADICSGKTDLTKCTAFTLYKIAKVLGIEVSDIIEDCFEKEESGCDFETFKSNIRHSISRDGEYSFIKKMLDGSDIIDLFETQEYSECFYLLGMLDYLSRINKLPLCKKYNDIRQYKLETKLYPRSILIMSQVFNNREILEKAERNSIPEFLNFNIIEGDLADGK